MESLDKEGFFNKLEQIDRLVDETEVLSISTEIQEICSIEELWEKFIKPRLPKPEVVKQWHEVLMAYVEDDNYDTVFPIRHNYKNQLLRGLLSKTDHHFYYFLTENEHAKYYYKLYLLGYVPKNSMVLKAAYHCRLFPLTHPGHKNEFTSASVPFPLKNSKIGNGEYYLAHILGVNEAFADERAEKIMKEDLKIEGIPNEWESLNKGKDFDSWCRGPIPVTDRARKIAVAAFLRYVHPLNYFLVPQSADWKENTKIGEYRPLINYVREQLKLLYKDEYEEFMEKIMENNERIINLTILKPDKKNNNAEIVKFLKTTNISPDEINEKFSTEGKQFLVEESKINNTNGEKFCKDSIKIGTLQYRRRMVKEMDKVKYKELINFIREQNS